MPVSKMNPVGLDKITIEDSFWKRYIELIRGHVLPYQWDALNDRIKDAAPSHCVHNFRVAAGLEDGGFEGMVFQDSDLYKWLEAVAYALMSQPDKALEKLADDTIDLIGLAQREDGYLDTYYIINGLDKRFTNLMDNHELYCFGHLTEAAVAYYNAVGKRKLLDIARRFAACVEAHIGFEPGKIPGYPGHEVAEMALVALYEVTNDPQHLKLARYFIDQRGQQPLFFHTERKRNNNHFLWEKSWPNMQYYQADRPVREQDTAEGHAVRAVYLYTGMAAVAGATGDEALLRACETIWKNITSRQMYVTGAIGAAAHGEAFTFDYDLPNDTVYAETCAAIGLIFFSRKMLALTRDAKYADVIERALYNSVISGMSLDGERFFYVNPLEVVPEAGAKDPGKAHVKVERQKWFGCACCPPNIARLMASIGGYAFAYLDETLYINLFIGASLELELGGVCIKLCVQTRYPWEGEVTFHIENDKPAEFSMAIRIPDWCSSSSLSVNGQPAGETMEKGYAFLHRVWRGGDEISLQMDMPVQLIAANPNVRENIGKVAVRRGPLVYALEEADNGKLLQQLFLDEKPEFTARFRPDLLGGIVIISAIGARFGAEGFNQDLYLPYAGKQFVPETLRFIPYYAWANRLPGEMLVWIKI